MLTQLKVSVLLTEGKPARAGEPQALCGSWQMSHDSSSAQAASDDGQATFALFVLFMEP